MNNKKDSLNPKRLRAFGCILGALLLAMGVYGWHKGSVVAPWFLVAGVVSFLLGLIDPLFLEPLHRHWLRMARGISRFNSYVILTLIYYLLLTPYGLILGLVYGDLLDRTWDNEKTSYWKRKQPGEGLSGYEKQFQLWRVPKENCMIRLELLRELWDFTRVRKKYWLVPIILIFVLFGLLLIVSETSVVAPFIYTLFQTQIS